MRRHAGVALACILTASALGVDAREPSPRDLINAHRPLAANEVARVLRAVRAAMAGKRGRLASANDELFGRGGTEFVVGRDGRPQWLRLTARLEGGIVGGIVGSGGDQSQTWSRTWDREITTITRFTRRPARVCDGASRPGELVIRYRTEGRGWTADADSDAPHVVPEPLFGLLGGALPLESGEFARSDGRQVRAFTTTWTLPSPPAPNPSPQYRSDDGGRTWTKETRPARRQLRLFLWIDTASLLPVGWDQRAVDDTAPASRERPYSVAVHYDDAVDIKPPRGVAPPACIDRAAPIP